MERERVMPCRRRWRSRRGAGSLFLFVALALLGMQLLFLAMNRDRVAAAAVYHEGMMRHQIFKNAVYLFSQSEAGCATLLSGRLITGAGTDTQATQALAGLTLPLAQLTLGTDIVTPGVSGPLTNDLNTLELRFASNPLLSVLPSGNRIYEATLVFRDNVRSPGALGFTGNPTISTGLSELRLQLEVDATTTAVLACRSDTPVQNSDELIDCSKLGSNGFLSAVSQAMSPTSDCEVAP